MIPTLIGLAFNAVVVVFVMLGYFRRLATKDDIKGLSDRLIDVEKRQSNVETRLGNVETRLDSVEASVRENGKKADASLALHNAVQVDVKVLQASVERLESYFETPKLKSS